MAADKMTKKLVHALGITLGLYFVMQMDRGALQIARNQPNTSTSTSIEQVAQSLKSPERTIPSVIR
jgi:hypothetical protein